MNAVADEELETENGAPELDAPVLAVTEAVVDIDPVDIDAAVVPDPDEPDTADAEAPDYVPMSEWLDDFDRR